MRLYLLGGENSFKKNAKSVNTEAFLDAGGSPNMLVFPWARPSFDKAYKRRNNVTTYFLSLGANTVEFVDYSSREDEISRKMKGSDLVYFTGGVASILVERLRKKGVDRLLRKFDKVIVGRSAGALAMCKTFVITRRKKKDMIIGEGLGFTNFRVKVHYDPSKDDGLRRLSNECPIIAIPCGSAVIHDIDSLSFLGEVYLFKNEEKIPLAKPLDRWSAEGSGNT